VVHINPYALILLASAAITLSIAPLVWHRKQVSGAKWFTMLLLSVGEWCLTYAIEILVISQASKMFWVKIEYLGIASLAPLWLMFSLTYTHKDEGFVGWKRFIIWIVPVITILLVFSNEYHHFHYIKIALSGESSGSQLVITHGPAFFLFTAYSYILLLIGSIALIWAIINFPHVYQKQATALIVGALIPWAINIIYILNLTSGYDPTPFGFSLTAIIYFWAIFRLDLFNVIPVARGMVIESMSDAMLVLDAQNHIADINPAAVRLTGIKHSPSVIGRPAGAVLSAFPELIERYSNVFETKGEIQINSKEGNGFYELEISPIRTQEGSVAGRIVVLRNVTDRKQTEETLKKSEALYHTLIETLPVAVFQKNNASCYTYVNHLYAENEGFAVEDILGKTDSELHTPALAEWYIKSDREIFSTGLSLEMEEEQQLANGKRIPIHVVKSPIFDPKGEIIGIQGMYWDITQIRRAALEAQERLDELTTIYAISQAVTQLEMEPLLSVVGENIEKTFNVRSVYIAFFDKKDSTISIPYWTINGNRINIPKIPYGKGLASEVIRTKQPLLINSEFEENSQRLNTQLIIADDYGLPKAWLGVPMIVGEDVIGLVSAHDYDHENAFTDTDINLFQTIASNVAIAFQNAQLYQEVQTELSERKRAESALAESQARLKAIFDNAGAGIGVTGLDAKYIFVNDRWAEMVGYTPGELSKMTIFDISHPEDIGVTREKFTALVNGQINGYQIEKRFRRKDGSYFWATVSSKPTRKTDGSIENAIGIITDITSLKKAEMELINANRLLNYQLQEIAALRDKLREQAIRDPLTNLYNRRFMEETLNLEIQKARRSHSLVSLVMMDIDHFKLVNDRFGHKTGDQVLEALGHMLLDNTRKSDVACRYGGEEFLIVLPNTDLEDAARRAEQFRVNFEALRVGDKNPLTKATMSIGVACFPTHGEDGERVLDRADEALYAAKAAGRNCVVVFNPERFS
jgi:diguanylate cyclase (GGDEF)-like protein/PAS domain S-box-containing protein